MGSSLPRKDLLNSSKTLSHSFGNFSSLSFKCVVGHQTPPLQAEITLSRWLRGVWRSGHHLPVLLPGPQIRHSCPHEPILLQLWGFLQEAFLEPLSCVRVPPPPPHTPSSMPLPHCFWNDLDFYSLPPLHSSTHRLLKDKGLCLILHCCCCC